MHLSEACEEVMLDTDVTKLYPDGLSGADILREIRRKHGDAFELCTVLDVCDEMTKLYGRGHNGH